MGTRSRIGIQLADKSILSVYCHYDGYPSFNGVKLQEHFNSYDAAAELIDGGDISCLWTNAGWNNEVLPTTAPLYYTSRGEEYNPPSLDSNLKNILPMVLKSMPICSKMVNGYVTIPEVGMKSIFNR
jgi:hypothetical protein